jgi:hypothetical protein
MTVKLREFLSATAHFHRQRRYEELLSCLSAQMKADAALVWAKDTLMRVPFFANGNIEDEFLASAALALKSRVYCITECVPPANRRSPAGRRTPLVGTRSPTAPVHVHMTCACVWLRVADVQAHLGRGDARRRTRHRRQEWVRRPVARARPRLHRRRSQRLPPAACRSYTAIGSRTGASRPRGRASAKTWCSTRSPSATCSQR